ncbi:MAG: hypothetical protein LBH84_09090 [Prevotellaceae bacterium]|nr:hypothetical protein [Prevotellaceae bacterium]
MEDNTGFAHIEEKHIKRHNDFESLGQAAEGIDDVIKNGAIVKNSADKATLEKNGYKVVVSKNVRDGQGNIIQTKNWVVTAFDITRTATEKRNASSDSELYTAKSTKAANGQATPLNERSSGSKGTN